MARRSIGERSFVVQGMDVGVEVIRKLRAEMKKSGSPDDWFHRLATPEGDSVVADMAKVMQEAWGFLTYAIAVDYTKTVEQMVASVKCDGYVNPDINTKSFGDEVVVKKGAKEDLEVVLLHLNREATSDEVLAEMERLGLRAATLAELLAFGAIYPEKQREFPIAALGSSCVLYGSRRVAYLWGNASRRDLGLDDLGGGWGAGWRFLAVRK